MFFMLTIKNKQFQQCIRMFYWQILIDEHRELILNFKFE